AAAREVPSPTTAEAKSPQVRIFPDAMTSKPTCSSTDMMSGARLAIMRPASETRNTAVPFRGCSGTRGSSMVVGCDGETELMEGPFARAEVRNSTKSFRLHKMVHAPRELVNPFANVDRPGRALHGTTDFTSSQPREDRTRGDRADRCGGRASDPAAGEEAGCEFVVAVSPCWGARRH